MQDYSKEIRVTAKTVEKAIKEAAIKLCVEEGEIDYRIVSQTNGGFLSFLGKKVEIAAKSIRTKPIRKGAAREKSVNSPTTNAPELTAGEIEALQEDLRKFCADICGYLSENEVKVEGEIVDGRLILDIDDEFMAAQVLKNSKLAEAIEHILRKKPRYLKRELPFRIFVDARRVRRDREAGLVELARDLSEKVGENKRPIVLNYKSSYDRKIIHMALDKDDRVYTKSIGSGANRKLMILPIKDREAAENAPVN